jgi:hypothetical protein
MQKGESLPGKYKIEVYSMQGNRVLTDMIFGDKNHQFSIPEAPAGLYFIRLFSANYTETIKLVKIR